MLGSGIRVWSLRLRVWGFRVQDSEFGVGGWGSRVCGWSFWFESLGLRNCVLISGQGLDFRLEVLEFRIRGLGLRVQGAGFLCIHATPPTTLPARTTPKLLLEIAKRGNGS